MKTLKLTISLITIGIFSTSMSFSQNLQIEDGLPPSDNPTIMIAGTAIHKKGNMSEAQKCAYIQDIAVAYETAVGNSELEAKVTHLIKEGVITPEAINKCNTSQKSKLLQRAMAEPKQTAKELEEEKRKEELEELQR